MGFKIVAICFFMLIITSVNGKNLQQKFDKAAFYAAMSSGDLDEVNRELVVITASSTPNKDGYEGALLMRKAGLIKRPAEKLKLFKAGRIKFDTALQNDKDNTEFRFLRFAIQEHAPKIVKYNKDLQADKQFILKEYKNLPTIVQQAILGYTKNSKILTAQELN
ncbi:hypothetical protein ACFQZS_06350 [Mucilaginibacter calamicampi]|uniref:DUF4142 domain-containing protein n=1 Tax=Mucilaginibacter calamicampi TaxID=1302352 RepID=A0ABW2YW19_9SPHI